MDLMQPSPELQGSYWDGFAGSFAALGPPLRPSAEEIGFMQEAIADSPAAQRADPLRALLLGVTPEIAAMRWPEKSSLMAVDNSFAMAKAVWPGNVPGRRTVVCGNWLAMPRTESSCHVVIGDGSINCLAYPGEFLALAEAVCRLLCEDGVLVLRCYVQGAVRERPEEVYADLTRGSISSFHAFKLRLLMAMQHSAEEGIAVNDVYQSWVTRAIEPESLPQGPGWRKAAVETIQFYRNRSTVYAFPTLADLRRVLRPFFEEISVSTASHDMGERCPTLAFRPCRKTSRKV
jgi:hypothetical protein